MARLPVVGGDNNQWGTLVNDYLLVAHNADGTQQNAITETVNWGKWFSANPGVLIPSGPILPLDWTTFFMGDSSLLDLTDPTVPIIVFEGIYAISVWWGAGGQFFAGKSAYAELLTASSSIDVGQNLDLGLTVNSTTTLADAGGYIAAGDNIRLNVNHDCGVDVHFTISMATVVKLA